MAMVGRCGQERQRGAADGEERRVRRTDAPGGRGQQDRGKQEEEERFERAHVRSPIIVARVRQ